MIVVPDASAAIEIVLFCLVPPREAFIGAWQYELDLAVWQRILHEDSRVELYRNGNKWLSWKGYSWLYKDCEILDFINTEGFVFNTMRMTGPDSAVFEGGPGYHAVRVELD